LILLYVKVLNAWHLLVLVFHFSEFANIHANTRTTINKVIAA
jgi:hypothetical protein